MMKHIEQTHTFSNKTNSEYVHEAYQMIFPWMGDPDIENIPAMPTNVYRLLHCPWCNNHPVTVGRIFQSTASGSYCCSSLYCFECHAEWHLCGTCSKNDTNPLFHGRGGSSRTACYERKKKFQEHVNWHQNLLDVMSENQINQQQIVPLIRNDDEELSSAASCIYDGEYTDKEWTENIEDPPDDDIHIDGSINSIRSVFNRQEYKHVADFIIREVMGDASKHVIQSSIMSSTLGSTSKSISQNDSLMFTTLLSLGTKMSREERNQLALLISLMKTKIENESIINSGEDTSWPYVRIPLPTSSYSMRKIFESGKQQFTNFMPLPPIHTPLPGYASVPLVETLRIIFSRGIDFDHYSGYRSAVHIGNVNSSTTRSIMDGSIAKTKVNGVLSILPDTDPHNILIQPIVLWSDSADINKVKNLRSSIKVHNVYIPNKNGQSSNYVFPVAIGSGKSSHDKYREILLTEIDDLHGQTVSCFNKTVNTELNVQFFLLAVVQDRPEHSEFTGTIAHNGTYGALPGISFPRSIKKGSLVGLSTEKDLVSCTVCYTRRVLALCQNRSQSSIVSVDNPCIICCDWDVMKMRFQRPNNMPHDIPEECYVDSDRTKHMIARKIDFETIQQTLQFIHDKSYNKQWTNFSKVVRVYASLQCISAAIATRVYCAAKTVREQHIRELGSICVPAPVMNRDLLPCAVTSVHLSMEQCMVGIMHTFFLNGGKKVITLIHDVFKKEKMGSMFLTKSKIYFRNLRSMSLSWIMAWPFGSTADKPVAPWVSENFVAFHHVSKSYLSVVCVRLIQLGKRAIAILLKLTISMWHRLLSIVMQPTTPTVDAIWNVGELAKLFLNKYHEIELYIGRLPKDWDLQNASCHLMLLLLPQYMTKFGCLRNYWEGGPMGERSITNLKKSLPHGAYMDGSVRTAIRRYFIDIVLSQLMEQEHCTTTALGDIMTEEGERMHEDTLNNNENCTRISYDRYRRFRVYKSQQTVRCTIINQNPFSLVFDQGPNAFYILTWGYLNSIRQRVMHPIECVNGLIKDGTYVISADDFLSQLIEDDEGINTTFTGVDSMKLTRFISCIALPYMINDDLDRDGNPLYFYVRTEHHMELRTSSVHVDGNLVVIPSFSYPSLYIET